jgi:hypothetical protein
MMRILAIIVFAYSLYATTLSNVEKGYATGAGLGAGQYIKMNYYNISKSKQYELCNQLLNKDPFAQRSKEHFKIALENCSKVPTK